MRSRAALLPYPADPFLLNYWLSLYEKHWCKEVDKLYIYANSPIEKPVIDYIKGLCLKYPNINFQYDSVQVEHGEVINRMLDVVTEKYIMLIEDDAFIFKSGIMDFCFSQIEAGNFKIVGSKRGSCAKEILDRAQEIWAIDTEGEGDQGCNFWPCYFFCEKDLLLKTDRNFGAKAWFRGEEILALSNNEVPYCVRDEVVYGDTFVNTSLQLHAMVPEIEILYVPQYHGHPDDLRHYREGYAHSMFNGMASWCHIGSLSSGVGGILRDDRNRALARRLIDQPEEKTELPKQWCSTEFEQREFERRTQWWLTFWQFAKIEKDSPMFEFYVLYGKAVEQIIDQYKLDRREIMKRQEAYASLGL